MSKQSFQLFYYKRKFKPISIIHKWVLFENKLFQKQSLDCLLQRVERKLEIWDAPLISIYSPVPFLHIKPQQLYSDIQQITLSHWTRGESTIYFYQDSGLWNIVPWLSRCRDYKDKLSGPNILPGHATIEHKNIVFIDLFSILVHLF